MRHVAGALIAIAIAAAAGCTDAASGERSDDTLELASVDVVRQDLVERKQVTARVGFGPERTLLVSDGSGVVTRPIAAGTVVAAGSPLVWIDERPVWLAAGDVPMYRELYRPQPGERDEAGDRLTNVVGDDVAQLQQFLIDSGFDLDGELLVDGDYGEITEDAVEALQAASNQPRTGRMSPGDIVFEPQPVRVATDIAVGTSIDELRVTSPERQVEASIDPADRRFFELESIVDLEYDDASGTGIVSSVIVVEAAEAALPRLQLVITSEDPVPPTAEIATVVGEYVLAADVLTVPGGALIVLSGGGFALETVDGRLIAVEVGEQADGLVEIDGDLQAGDEVLAPS